MRVAVDRDPLPAPHSKALREPTRQSIDTFEDFGPGEEFVAAQRELLKHDTPGGAPLPICAEDGAGAQAVPLRRKFDDALKQGI
tara:strand:- start:46 stop:297 length:252 start_codon:yes stop_codon:yes gene_type:complete